MLIRTVLALAAVGCAAEHEPDTETTIAYSGATCGNGAYDPFELCVANPGPIVLATGAQVLTVLAVDVNGDAVRDIVALTATRVWIRHGVAGGGFGTTTWYWTAGADYRDVAAGDFDADGDLDLAATDAGTDRVIVWRNNGAFFGMWQQIAIGDEPTRILATRLDGDARADLAVLSDGSNQLYIIRATAAPFALPIPYAAGDAHDIALGDCDADGRRDVLYINGTMAATTIRARRNVDNFANLGAAITTAFPLAAPGFGGLEPFVLAAGDFDGSGDADVAVATSWSFIAPAVSNGNCTFAATPKSQTWAWTRTRLRAFDWNSDGDLDLGAPHGLGGDGSPEVYSVMFGNGTGSFPIRQIESHPSETVIPKDLAMLDANADGHLDMLLAGATGVYLERRID